jgi:hypothetical protein
MTAAVAPKLTLHDLGEAQDILDGMFLVETEGEYTPEIAQLDAWINDHVEEKVERWGLWIRGQSLQADLIKTEEERLRARRKAIENAIEHSKRALQANMERLGRDKVKGKLLTVAIQKNPPAVTCENIQAVYEGPQGDLFATREERIDFRLNRDVVLETWKAGQGLPPGVVVTQGSSIRLR